VTGKINDWRGWLWAIPQATTFFGLAMIALIWGAVEFDLNAEYERSQASSLQSTTNLARLFEDQIVRTIKSNDRILKSLQTSSASGTLQPDFDRWSREIDGAGDFTAVLSLINADGILVASSYGPLPEQLDVNDREYFQVHRDANKTGLFISEPIVNRITNTPVIQLTRALRAPHGEFAGVIVASLSANKLVRFYASVDLGPDGAISLTGLDGIVRASAGLRGNMVGRSMAGSELLRRVRTSEAGTYASPGIVDGIARLISYRLVEGYPLAVWVGRAESDVFGTYRSNRYSYRSIASGLTLCVLVVVILNIRHRRGLERARKELRASEANAREKSRELELTLDHMSQGIMMIDKDTNVALMNRQAVNLLGLPEDMIAQRPKFGDLVAYQRQGGEFGSGGRPTDPDLHPSIGAALSKPVLSSYERTRPNGVVLEVRSVDLPDGGFVRTFTDISDRKRNENKIAHMAHHDALTGLANRALLRDRVETALKRQRRQGEGFALLLIDLDRFKQVNDTQGHGAGDTLLRCVAQRLKSCARDVDTVARLGGDEFAILQVATADRGSVEALGRRVVEAISAPYTHDGIPATVGASIGIARSVDSPDIEQLFHNADLALYRVKSQGRNNFRLFESEMDAAAQARRQIEGDLRLALERSEFEIFYQPMFALATGKVSTVEALLRWNHPTRGRIAPDAFMTAAEEIGLMPAIDAWVLKTACVQAATWSGEIVLAANLSPAIFARETLADVVRTALANAGLPARRLELEISERIMLHEEPGTLAHLRALHDLGVRVALDDFGVAHSSLSDLRVFSFDKIKIDRSFVSELEISQESAAIVAAIATLGRNLGAETTAEGVETQRQAELVRAAGCTEAQGYLYSRPVPAAEIRALLNHAEAKRAVA
jgi:diguanylate cyclase (GGDEF)-like protein